MRKLLTPVDFCGVPLDGPLVTPEQAGAVSLASWPVIDTASYDAARALCYTDAPRMVHLVSHNSRGIEAIAHGLEFRCTLCEAEAVAWEKQQWIVGQPMIHPVKP